MKFEWDENKSESNKIKHGVDFEGAQLLWEDCDRVEIAIQSEGEQRYLTIGLAQQTLDSNNHIQRIKCTFNFCQAFTNR